MLTINTQDSTSAKLMFKFWTYCTRRPLPDGTRANSRIYMCLIFLEATITGLHYAAYNEGYLCWNCYGWLRNTILFLQEWRFGRSRSSKVIDVSAGRKGVCDFLLVRHSNFGPILHRFGDRPGVFCSWPYPYSTLILEVFLLHQIAHVGVNV